jgi:hypothetical protein
VIFDAQRLYELLPAIYRIRDAEQGEPLRALLAVIAEQAGVLEENLAQLYDDQFVETSAPWSLPYIGDLIGLTGLPATTVPALNPRAEVAHTIGYRRRKGTAATLEQLARDVSGWPARAVEFFQLIAATQYLNHIRPENQSFVSVRGADRLEYLGGAFEHAGATGTAAADLTHTVDVRRIARGRGRYNIPNVGLFLWRLESFALTRSPAVPAAPGDRRRFLFSPLGVDAPLFSLPVTETEATGLAQPINVPDRIRRRVLKRSFEDYYGRGRSLLIEREDADMSLAPTAIAPGDIVVCDLTGWHNIPTDKIAVDPVLGRIAFPQDEAGRVLLTFHYGFSARMGGGEYSRRRAADARRIVRDADDKPVALPVNRVANSYAGEGSQPPVPFTTIADALADLDPRGGTVEILNSGRYAETPGIDATGKLVTLRAGDKRRPIVVLGADLVITGGANDEVVLDGLLIAGGGLIVDGGLGRLVLRHCTLVPGIRLLADGEPELPGAPSLTVSAASTRVEIDHCILGAIRAHVDAEVRIADSIVDATDETVLAYAGPSGFGAPLTVTNSTIIGLVRTSIMRLASNSLFIASFASAADKASLTAPVMAERRQEGCVRFSYVSAGARLPPRYQCQPQTDGSLIRPQLVSTRFHDPAYCQLSPSTPAEIRKGADDEASMGAFHDLFEPQREARLRTRVDEYLRFGLEAGVFYAS